MIEFLGRLHASTDYYTNFSIVVCDASYSNSSKYCYTILVNVDWSLV